jgi:hypothetical protein
MNHRHKEERMRMETVEPDLQPGKFKGRYRGWALSRGAPGNRQV